MSGLAVLGAACFAAICWGHGYARGRMAGDSLRFWSRCGAAYLRGRRDERAVQEDRL